MKLQDLKNKVKHKVDSSIVYNGYVLYIWNPEKLQGKLHPLTEVKSTLTIRSTAETFELGKPALFLEGKPLFIVIRGIPYSIELDITNDETRKILKEKGYSPSEIDAKINSIYVNRIFRAKRLTTLDWILYILSLLCTALIVAFFFMVGGF